MLGVNSPREPITPEFSRKIRAALWRAKTGNLTPEEKDAIRRGREARKKVKIVWKQTFLTSRLKRYKDTLRMFRTLYANEEEYVDEQ